MFIRWPTGRRVSGSAVLKLAKFVPLCAAGLTACGEDPAREAVAAAFPEPGSARFQSVRELADHVCGEVNGLGRNGFLLGYKRFVYDKRADLAVIEPEGIPAARAAEGGPACRKPFAYQTVDERLSCADAPVAKVEENRKSRFEALWAEQCA